MTERCLREIGSRVSLFQSQLSTVEKDVDASSGLENQPVYIRRLIFSPALPIRFNYHGHQLDLTQVSCYLFPMNRSVFFWHLHNCVMDLNFVIIQGTLVGLLALCLQLRNAEFIFPQYTYQNGYKGVASLIEAVGMHWTRILYNNLTQIVITSVGPMHEVSSISKLFFLCVLRGSTLVASVQVCVKFQIIF